MALWVALPVSAAAIGFTYQGAEERTLSLREGVWVKVIHSQREAPRATRSRPRGLLQAPCSANFMAFRILAPATQLFFGYGLLRKRTPFHDIESVAEVREEGKRREHFLSSHRPERLAPAIANQLSRQPAIPLEDIAASRLAFGGTAPTCRGPGPARGHDI